jgi:hypothetical protein
MAKAVLDGHNIFEASIAIQNICLGVNATSTVYYYFELRVQNPRVLGALSNLEKFMAYKTVITFKARIVLGDQYYVHHLLQLYLKL